MKTFWKIGAAVAIVAILAAAGLVMVVVAQDQGRSDTGLLADWRQEMHDAIARALGISVGQYDAAVEQARDEVLDKAIEDGQLTQEQADRVRERAAQGLAPGILDGAGPMRGQGRGGRGSMMGGSEDSLIVVAADQLGMTVEELQAELAAGKTIAAVAGEKGVATQLIVDAFLAPRQEWLSQAVADGRITQEQADQMLERMTDMVTGHIDGTLPLGSSGCGQSSGQGGCQGHCGGGMMGWGRTGGTDQ